MTKEERYRFRLQWSICTFTDFFGDKYPVMISHAFFKHNKLRVCITKKLKRPPRDSFYVWGIEVGLKSNIFLNKE